MVNDGSYMVNLWLIDVFYYLAGGDWNIDLVWDNDV